MASTQHSMVTALRCSNFSPPTTPFSSLIHDQARNSELWNELQAARFEMYTRENAETSFKLFMAIQLLDPEIENIRQDTCHDLESFYWVLLWMVLRHTAYVHIDAGAWRRAFVHGDDELAVSAKVAWLVRRKQLDIPDNKPLGALLAAFHKLVSNAVLYEFREDTQVPLTYAAVLRIFEIALGPGCRSMNDGSDHGRQATVPCHLPEARTQTRSSTTC
ncbi:hypothetical protein OH77DRAFT_1431044 [Trametes cingulata]|nr:hypothetical protein OH77DRAFT_1431044 [Trametes cingulata]